MEQSKGTQYLLVRRDSHRRSGIRVVKVQDYGEYNKRFYTGSLEPTIYYSLNEALYHRCIIISKELSNTHNRIGYKSYNDLKPAIKGHFDKLQRKIAKILEESPELGI
jgi:hypothetical protein